LAEWHFANYPYMVMASDCIFAVAFFIPNVSTAHDFVVAHVKKNNDLLEQIFWTF